MQLDDLVQDARFQVRDQLEPGTIEKYALALRSGAVLPAVMVALVNGALVLVDGWHRVAAHRRLGWDRIDAEVCEASEDDALWMAAHANLTHGLPLKRREVRKAFVAFMRARKYRLGRNRLMPLRDIARALGGSISHESVRRWMMADFPNVASRYSAGNGDKRADPRAPNPSVILRESAEAGLKHALAAARGVSCPLARGILVKMAEGALHELRDGGPYRLPPEEAPLMF